MGHICVVKREHSVIIGDQIIKASFKKQNILIRSGEFVLWGPFCGESTGSSEDSQQDH